MERIFSRQAIRTGYFDRRSKYPSIFHWIALVCFVVLFVNCQNFEEGQEPSNIETCVKFNDNLCVQASSENLSLRILSSDISIKAKQFSLNISGDCNEGAFFNNVINWKLYVGSQLVSDSAGGQVPSQCIQGRFLLLVQLPVEASSPSLSVDGSRIQHSLVVELVGQDKKGRLHRNESLAKRAIYINPI